jgi:hypothetical protein
LESDDAKDSGKGKVGHGEGLRAKLRSTVLQVHKWHSP